MLELTREVTKDILRIGKTMRSISFVKSEDKAYGAMAAHAALEAMRAGFGRWSIIERLRAFVAADAEHHGDTHGLDEPTALIAGVRAGKIDVSHPYLREEPLSKPQLHREKWITLAKHERAMWCVAELAIWSETPDEVMKGGFIGEIAQEAAYIALALGADAAEDMVAALRLLVEEAKQ